MSDMNIQFKIGANFSDLKAAFAQIKTEFSAVVHEVKSKAQDIKIQVGLDLSTINADIQSIKRTVATQLQQPHSVKVRVEADLSALHAQLGGIGGSGIVAANTGFKVGVDLPYLRNQLVVAMRMVQAAINTMGNLGQTVNLNVNLSGSVAGLVTAIDSLKAEVVLLRQAMSSHSLSAGAGNSSSSVGNNWLAGEISSLKSSIMQLVGAFGVVSGIKAFVDITDQAKKLETQIKLITSSQEEANQVMAALRGIAKNNLQGLEPTVDLYAKISSSTKNLEGANAGLSTRLTDIISKLMTIGNSTGPSASAAILQFGQALSGNFSSAGAELNSVIEQAPALADAMAKVYNTDRAGLKKLGAEGKVTTEGIVNGLLKQGVEVDALFGKVNKTVSGTAATTSDAIKKLISDFDKATGLSSSVISALESLRDKATQVWAQMEADSFSSAKKWASYLLDAIELLAGYGITRLVAGITLSVQSFYQQVAAGQAAARQALANAQADAAAAGAALRRAEAEKALALAELARARAGALSADQTATAVARAASASATATAAAAAHASAQRALAAATTQANLVMRAGAGVIAALGGPIGALITVLGIAATAWSIFGDKAEQAADKVKEAIDKIKKNKPVSDDDLNTLNDAEKTIDVELKMRENPLYKSFNTDENKKRIAELKKQKTEIQKALDKAEFDRNVDSLLNNQDVGEVKAKPKPSAADPNATEKARLEAELQIIEAKYAAEEIGLNKYYRDKSGIIQKIRDAELKAINAKMDAENDASKKSDLMTKKAEIEAKYSGDRDALLADRQKAIKDVNKERIKLAFEVDQASLDSTGKEIIAKRAELERKLEDDLKSTREKIHESMFQSGSDGFALFDEKGVTLLSEAGKQELQRQEDALRKNFNQASLALNLKQIEADIKQFANAQARKVKTVDSLQQQGQISDPEADRQKKAINQATSSGLSAYRGELQKLVDEDVPNAKAALDDLNAKITEIPESASINFQVLFENFNQELKNTGANAAKSGLAQFFIDLASRSKSAGDAFKDFARSFAQSMAQVAANALATLAVVSLLQAVGVPVSLVGGNISFSASTDKASGAVNLMKQQVESHHTGGIAGRSSTRREIDTTAFLGARRYHTGGLVGLKSDEVPAILQKGEEVLTRNDPRHAANGGVQASSTRIINVIDPNLVGDYLGSSSGEQTIVNLIERNAGAIKQLLT